MDKVKELRLTVSSKDDVIRIFGKDCKYTCEFDADWKISFTYFERIGKIIDEGGVKVVYIPDPKYAGRLYQIKFIPKKNISFEKVTFPDTFKIFKSEAFGPLFSSNGDKLSFDNYTDSHGLRYVVFKAEGNTTSDKKDARRDGDLVSIEYFIPKEKEEQMYVKKN